MSKPTQFRGTKKNLADFPIYKIQTPNSQYILHNETGYSLEYAMNYFGQSTLGMKHILLPTNFQRSRPRDKVVSQFSPSVSPERYSVTHASDFMQHFKWSRKIEGQEEQTKIDKLWIIKPLEFRSGFISTSPYGSALSFVWKTGGFYDRL